jgi:RND family efflux transporter MFP subunit
MTSRAIGLCLLACLIFLPGGAPGEDKPKEKSPTVAVAHPVVREVSDYADFTGRVEAASTVVVQPRVTGQLLRVAFKAGDTVKKGDLLFEIDPRLYQAEVNKANADVELAEARLKRVAADLERMKKLLAARAISKEEYDAAHCAVTEAKTAVQATRAAGEVARLNLSFTKVAAPITGRITRPSITEGNLVQADQTRLATIYSVDPILVGFDIDEGTFVSLTRLKREGKLPVELVRMALAGEKGFPHRGKLDSIDVRVDPHKGTLRCTAAFNNTDGVLLPGMFACVRMTVSAPRKALLVSEEAMTSEGSTGRKPSELWHRVFVVNAKNIVEARQVKRGLRHGNLREVTAGLKAEERVIVDGSGTDLVGKTVEVLEVPMPGTEDGKKGAKKK